MAALANSVVAAQAFSSKWLNDGSSKSLHQSVDCKSLSSSLSIINPKKEKLGYSKQQRVAIRAGLSDNTGRQSDTSNIFVGGFILGGLIVGALGYVYAPKISNALAGADKKDLMKKLPWYDEEKALEKTRKILEKKIAQLNLAIDGVSSDLRSEDASSGSASTPDEVESAV